MLNHYQHIINTLVATIDGIKEVILLAADGLWSGAWYHFTTLPWDTLFSFALGAAIGVIVFVKLLHRVKKHYHDQLIAVLIGLMIGALHKVWPYKKVLEEFTDRHGEVRPLIEQNILPPTRESALWGIAFVVLGMVLVLGIDFLAKKK